MSLLRERTTQQLVLVLEAQVVEMLNDPIVKKAAEKYLIYNFPSYDLNFLLCFVCDCSFLSRHSRSGVNVPYTCIFRLFGCHIDL